MGSLVLIFPFLCAATAEDDALGLSLVQKRAKVVTKLGETTVVASSGPKQLSVCRPMVCNDWCHEMHDGGIHVNIPTAAECLQICEGTEGVMCCGWNSNSNQCVALRRIGSTDVGDAPYGRMDMSVKGEAYAAAGCGPPPSMPPPAFWHSTNFPTCAWLPPQAPLAESTAAASALNCDDMLTLDLGDLEQNSLGYGSKDDQLRYGSVATVDGNDVDLVITSRGDSASSVFQNGYMSLEGDDRICKVEQMPASSMHLNFEFKDHSTDVPVNLENFALTFFGVAGSARGESMSVYGASAVSVSDGSSLVKQQITETGWAGEQGSCTLLAPQDMRRGAAPTDVTSLTNNQRNHAFTAFFSTASGFDIKTNLTGKVEDATSVTLLFAGVGVFNCPGGAPAPSVSNVGGSSGCPPDAEDSFCSARTSFTDVKDSTEQECLDACKAAAYCNAYSWQRATDLCTLYEGCTATSVTAGWSTHWMCNGD